MKLKDISSSDLKKRISIITNVPAVDEDGLSIQKPSILVEKFAKVTTPSLRKQEIYKGEGLSVVKTLEFIFRYIEIDESAQIKYRDKIYNICGIENVEEKDKFLCVMGECVS